MFMESTTAELRLWGISVPGFRWLLLNTNLHPREHISKLIMNRLTL